MAKPITTKKAGLRAKEAVSADLLLEIGTEELPYQFIAPALRSLGDAAERLFKEHRLAHGAIRTFGTPRRLVLAVQSLAGRQTAAVKEAMGPSKAIAYGPDGAPTKALVGFMTGQRVTEADVQVRTTPKGEYVFAVKRDEGRPAAAVLAELLPGMICVLAFPKSMKWSETGVRFARPIRWLVATFAGAPLSFQIGGVSSGQKTQGHRFLGPGGKGNRQGLPVKDLASYLAVLKKHFVVPEQDERRRLINKELEELAKSARGHLHRDEELLEQAVFTVEYPHAILGEFNPQYLSLPKEIIMTAMKEHQGFFALMDREGRMLSRFISVTNMKLSDMKLIKQGNERVLAARLADAKFYFEEDCKEKLGTLVERLRGVTFHQKLGTLLQKTQRVVKLAEVLAGQLKSDRALRDAVSRAAQLSKADLLTGIVGQFPSLQGVMGSEYAKRSGEPAEVSRAIAEQYLPQSMEGALPETTAGRILSLADRLDTIVSFFHVGLIPTGSEDPFALRRHAAAVVRLVVEGNLRVNLAEVAAAAKQLVEQDGFKAAASAGAGPIEFVAERLRYYGRTAHRLREDVMDAVIKSMKPDSGDLLDLLARMKALQAITIRPEFDPLMIGFKRAHRLVDKENWKQDEVNPTLFQHPTEAELHKALDGARLQVPFAIEQGNYETALNGLVALKTPIDAFFTAVMVNAEEQELRKNRLSLLCAIDRLFMSFADFSQIVVQGA